MSTSSRGATVAAWWPWLVLPALATGLVAAGAVLVLAYADGSGLVGEALVNVPLSIGFSTVAAGIWSTRPHPPGVRRLGALYTVVGLGSACVLPAYGWGHSDLAGAGFGEWVSAWVWALGAAPLLGLGLLLYPDGLLPSPRWWPAAVLGIAGTTVLVLSSGIDPTVAGAGFVAVMAAAMLGLAALVVKFRRAPAGGSRRNQIGGFAIAGALVVVAALVPSGNDLASAVLSLAAGCALPVTVGVAVVRHQLLDQRATVAELHRRVGVLAEARRSIVTEREDERVRLRRELHDGLGPSLAAIGLGLRSLQRTAVDGQDATALRELGDEVSRAVDEVRRICQGLQPAALDELGLAGALAAALGPLRRFGPEIDLATCPLPALPPATEAATFRIAMEAATNAVRHADAGRVTVRVRYDDGVSLTVADDGRGLVGRSRPGIGLQAMTERAEELGGWLRIEGRSPHGTAVHAWLPGGEA